MTTRRLRGGLGGPIIATGPLAPLRPPPPPPPPHHRLRRRYRPEEAEVGAGRTDGKKELRSFVATLSYPLLLAFLLRSLPLRRPAPLPLLRMGSTNRIK
ncbi:unnamed protein product [Ectocarpus sp. 12 AP-2014]